jgi:UDP-N-acetylglucosamine 2-epimerase (non-hydrolysing)/GDP/UDP-N,N'-diacetylbacillosamine 2-epimerase (hydrolysing)
MVFTQHSVTTEFDQAASQISPSLEAMRRAAADGVQVVLTYPNNDAGGRIIISALEAFAAEGIEGVTLHRSMGRAGYHGVLALAQDINHRVACAGNSSSGVKETPAFGCPTINIGSRQDGRLRGSNVIDAGYDSDAIFAAIRKSLFDDPWRRQCAETDNPYGQGNAGEIIASFLATVNLEPKNILRKKMTLTGEVRDGWFR